MTIPEVIAYLDRLEGEVNEFRLNLRQLRYDLFETLDNDPDDLVG